MLGAVRLGARCWVLPRVLQQLSWGASLLQGPVTGLSFVPQMRTMKP